MRAASPLAALSLCASFAVVPLVARGAVVFRPLPDLPGGVTESRAWGISRDGSTIVGSSFDSAGQAAARWTIAGVEALEPADQSAQSDRPYSALAVSSDGRVITGIMGPGMRAFVWTAAPHTTGFRTRRLPDLPGAAILSTRASDIDDDGRYIVGSAHPSDSTPANPRIQAVYWDTAATPPLVRGLGYLTSPALPFSNAVGVSGDGATIIGDGRGPSAIVPFVMGRDAPAMTPLQLTFTATGDAVSSISRDGHTMVGSMGRRAFRWDGQLALLDSPDLGWSTSAAAVSDDGSIVVGSAQPASLGRTSAVLWDRAGHARLLGEFLESDYGVDLSGWSLVAATAVSGDGLTIAGYGINPVGQTQAFVVQVPAPFAIAPIAVGALVRRRRA